MKLSFNENWICYKTGEKEDAFADRIVGKVERKVLSNLPALLGLYVKKDYEEE